MSQPRSLRHTVIATLLIGFGMLTAAQYLVTRAFTTRQVESIEIDDAFGKLQRLHYAFEQLRDDLTRTTTDWAEWDATHNFVLGKAPEFPEENLTIETFERLQLNVIIVVDERREVSFAKLLAPRGRQLTDVPPDLIAAARRSADQPDRAGFVASGLGPMLISVRQVHDSVAGEISEGRLLMGRLLSELEPIVSRVTAVPMQIQPLAASVPAAESEAAAIQRERDSIVVHDAKIEGSTLIDDVWGAPLASLHATLDRPLRPDLSRALRYLLGVTLLVGTAFGVAVVLVLRMRVVEPIERLAADVGALGADGAAAYRLNERDHQHASEFLALSRSINSMLQQIQLQQSLRADRDAAVEANRLKSEFLATMSHEIRTPMNGVLGMCELLQRTDLNQRQRHLADTLLRSARSLLGILNDILDFSKIESGKLHLEAAPFSPHDVLQTASAPFIAAAHAKGLEFHTHVDAAVPALAIGDSLRMRQVLNNLLSNAVKFTTAGSIHVNCCVDSCDAQHLMLRIVVTDTGIGIAADALPRIFDAFAQAESSTTRNFGGTGLGLAIARRIAELMGGEVGVDSDPLQGSRFWFTLRLQRALAPTTPAATGSDTAPGLATTHPPRVLLAEDNPVNREVLTEMLQVLGCIVTAVENGALAVAAAAERDFDAVLMDCQMPVMDGHAATAELRALERASGRPRAFVVALTADATTENRQRCLDVGMDAVTTKPISQTRLRDLILQAVDQR